MNVAMTAILTPKPNPLPDLSNSHHKPIDIAASVKDSWKLLAKSNFWYQLRNTMLIAFSGTKEN